MPISRCCTIESASSCTTSIGSSTVTMCARRVLLMWPIIDAIVVVLPVPVGPVISTSPRGESASVRMTSGRRSSSNVGISERTRRIAKPDDAALTEHVHPEPTDAGERDAEVGLAGLLELPLLVVRHQLHPERLGVGGREGGERRGLELAVDADERDVADLQVQVARAALHRVPEQLVDLHRASFPRSCRSATRRPCLRHTIGTFAHHPKRQVHGRCSPAVAASREPRIPAMTSSIAPRRRAVTAGRPPRKRRRGAASVRSVEGRSSKDSTSRRGLPASRPGARNTGSSQDRDPDGGIGRRRRLPSRAPTASRWSSPPGGRDGATSRGASRRAGSRPTSPRRKPRCARFARRRGSRRRSRPRSARRGTSTCGRTCVSARPCTSS